MKYNKKIHGKTDTQIGYMGNVPLIRNDLEIAHDGLNIAPDIGQHRNCQPLAKNNNKHKTIENMTTTIETLKNEFDAITLIKVFEVEVLHKMTQQTEYIIFDISIDGDTLRAEHSALTIKESDSDMIPFKSIELDDCFSLDESLQELYSKCIEAICHSDFFELV